MIDFITDLTDDLEKTQRLPTLTAEVQLDDALQRERASRIEIVELLRQNLQQAKEIEHLRGKLAATPTLEAQATTEEKLFEVCGALKETLLAVLSECRTRNVALDCESSAGRVLEDSCDKLEHILSAPGFSASPVYHVEVAQNIRVWSAGE